MNDLREILKFVTSEIKINSDIFQKIVFQQKDKKLSSLVTFIQQHQEASDEEAIKAVYGNTRKTGRYRVLKLRLKDKLLNLVFLSDTNLSFKNPYTITIFRISRNILAAKFLILKDKRAHGIPMLRASLKTALQYELTPEAIECCSLLCYHAAYYSESAKELKKYQALFNSQLFILDQERKMEALYNNSLWHAKNTAGNDKRRLQVLQNNFIKAGVIHRKYSSYNMELYYNRIAYYYYHNRNQFRNVIKTCIGFITYLSRHKYLYQDARLGEFTLYIMEGCMRLGDFETAKKYAHRCSGHYIPYSSPWLQSYEFYFLLAMRTGNFSEAQKIHRDITTAVGFYKLPENQTERWRIYAAYLDFALPDELRKKRFNLFKFLNDVPISNRDKPGYNFSILLAKIIFLINIKDTDQLLDAKFAFREYFRRYIKKERHPRSFYFGCIMLQLFKNDFDFKNADKIISHFLKELKGKKNNLNPVEETEVIPYEILWELLKEKIEIREIRNLAAA